MKIDTLGIVMQLLLTAPSFMCGEEKPAEAVYWRQENSAFFYQTLAAARLELGQFSEALNNIEKALAFYETCDSSVMETRLRIVDSHVLKGRLLGFLDQFAESVGELLLAFEENAAIRSEEDLETIRLYKHLGWHLSRLGNNRGSLDELAGFCSELDTLTVYLSKFDPSIAMQTTSLTALYLAQKCYERALSADKKAFGESHPETAKSYSLIGWMLGDQGKYLEALEYHMKALDIRLKCFTEVHPNIARSYSHIGWNYEKLGDLNRARQYYEMALRIKEETLPQDHPELNENRKNLQRVSQL